MPIILQRNAPGLWADPALQALDPDVAARQDVRPLRIALINHAAEKVDGDLRIARLLSNSAMQVELTVVHDQGENDQDISPYLLHFYRNITEIRERSFDALVVIGPSRNAGTVDDPRLAEDVSTDITGAPSWHGAELYIGGAAIDALRLIYGVHPRGLPPRPRGIHWHYLKQPSSPLVRGHDRTFAVPITDPNGIGTNDLWGDHGLDVVAESEDVGIHILHQGVRRQTFVLNDITVDADALGRGWRSTPSLSSGMTAGVTGNAPPRAYGWSAHAQLVTANWLTHNVLPATMPG